MDMTNMQDTVADKYTEPIICWEPLYEDGNLIGIGDCLGFKERGEAHKKGYWHREVVLFLVDAKTRSLLTIKRSFFKGSYPGKRGTVAGHVAEADSVRLSVLKEGEEELLMPLVSLIESLVDDAHCATKHFPNCRIEPDGKINNALMSSFIIDIAELKAHASEELVSQILDRMSIDKRESAGVSWDTLKEFKEYMHAEGGVIKDSVYYQMVAHNISRIFDGKPINTYQTEYQEKIKEDVTAVQTAFAEERRKRLKNGVVRTASFRSSIQTVFDDRVVFGGSEQV